MTLPRLIGDLVKLVDTADAEMASILSGPGLHHSFSSWRYMQAAVTSKDIRAQFHASLANCTNAFVTLMCEPFASPCGTDEGDALMAG